MYQETEGLNLIAWIVLVIFAVPGALIAAVVVAVIFAVCVYTICFKELAKAAVTWLLSFGGPNDAFN